MKFMRSLAGLMAALCSIVHAADDTTAASVLVETQPVRRGQITHHLTAYGQVSPAIDANLTLSVQAEGRVVRIDVMPGEAVHPGQRLLEFHLSAAATTLHAQAAAALELAKEEEARVARLLNQRLATRDQKALADKALVDARTALDAIERETGGQPKQTLVAPFDGVVNTVPVAQGDRVVAGAPLMTLVRSKGLVVTCGIEPSELPRVAVGQAVTLHPLGRGMESSKGTVVRLGRSLNPRTRLVDADIGVDAVSLLQGTAYRADIAAGRIEGWLLPGSAVLDDDAGAYVFQISGALAKRVSVTRVGSEGDAAVVDGPIEPALPVVVSGNSQLEDGGAVRSVPRGGDAGKDAANARGGPP